MRKFVFIEKLPSGNYSVRHWQGAKFEREWFSDYGLAKRRAADLTLALMAKRQGQPDPTIKPIDIVYRYLNSLQNTHRPITIRMKKETLVPFADRSQHITEQRVKDWIEEMGNKQLSVSTIAIRLRDLKTFCKWAAKEKLLQEDVFANIKVPMAKERGRKLSIQEVEAIFKAADENFKPFLGFLIYTGARRGEILKSKWLDIDLERKVWRIPAENCKTKRERYVPLDDRLVELLSAMPNPHPLVFYNFSRHHPSHLLSKACKKIGLALPRIHDFRHTFASFWNGDPRRLMDMVGWKSMTMLKRYSHFTVEDVRQESEKKGIATNLKI